MTVTPAASAGTAERTHPFALGRLVVVAVIAAAVNAAVFGIGSAAGASMTIDSPAYSQITLVMTVVATLVPLLLAGVVTWAISRKSPGFRRVALWLGLAVALLSIVSPFVVGNDAATIASLVAMHLVAAAAWGVSVAGPRRGA